MSDKILHVNRARHIRDHLLEIDFDDGTRKVVDVAPLLDEGFFGRLTVDPVSRTIVWPNGADLAPEALYELPAVHQVA